MKATLARRRALSSVISAGIMLSAMAILGTTLVSWSNTNLSSRETVLSNTASSNINKINENLVIENIAFCSSCSSPSNKVINVTLTNTGTLSVTVPTIKINSTTITTFAKGTSLPQNIFPQKSYTVAAQLPTGITWKSKSIDTITVTTARGSIYTTQAAPP